MRRALGFVLASLALASCSSEVAPAGDGSRAPLSSPAPLPTSGTPAGLPVDTTLEAVSASAPSAEAKAALDLCGVDAARGQVAGMALVPSSKEVGKYAPMYGTEPELKTDRPAWVIQLKGEIQGRVGVLVDPTCVVIDGV